MTKPILFNTEMVKALLDGRKTVTRRIVKPQPPTSATIKYRHENFDWAFWSDAPDGHLIKPPCRTGDILYVRETYGTYSTFNGHSYVYKGDYIDSENLDKAKKLIKRWIPSIHMPREAARIFLRVTDVRVERLQDIECIATEGIAMVPADDKRDPRYYFAKLWDSTVKKSDLPLYGWEASPWVWVISFERVEKNEALQ